MGGGFGAYSANIDNTLSCCGAGDLALWVRGSGSSSRGIVTTKDLVVEEASAQISRAIVRGLASGSETVEPTAAFARTRSVWSACGLVAYSCQG